MSVSRPVIPPRTATRTFYLRPFLDRLTGHYVVSWTVEGAQRSIRVHNRLHDFEGHGPSLRSVWMIPRVVSTVLEARRRPLLRRPLPFVNFDAIAHLRTIVGAGTRVVEVGGGNSTLWFLERGAHVTTFEPDTGWSAALDREAAQRGLVPRLELCCVGGPEALLALASLPDDTADLLVVDCKNEHTWRYDAVAIGRSKVRAGGWLCLDDSDHPNNWPAVELMADRERVRFTGFGPMCACVTQTSFWQL
jgi:hypothetical protein